MSDELLPASFIGPVGPIHTDWQSIARAAQIEREELRAQTIFSFVLATGAWNDSYVVLPQANFPEDKSRTFHIAERPH